jgi:serine/threonine protein kinase
MPAKNPWEEKWDFVSELPPGGQATTFRVKSKPDSTINGVIKQLKNNKSAQARRSIFKEVASLRIVANANGSVPRVLDDNVGEFENDSIKLYFVMEYIAGKTLDDYVKERGHLDLESAVNLVLDICNTIKIAHDQDVLHRDLKPKNIVVDSKDGQIHTTILDYGLSFNNDDSQEDITKANERFRNEFLSLPETNIVDGNRRDPRSDYTAICGIFYFCLTGYYPELLRDGGDNPPNNRKGKSIREILDNSTKLPSLDTFFHIGFAPNISERFQNLDDVIKRLNAIKDNSTLPPAEDPKIVASRFSAIIRKNNRSVQIGEIRNKIDQVLLEFSNYAIKQIGQRLDHFIVQFMKISHTLQLPAGIDEVGAQSVIYVKLDHSNKSEYIIYKIGSVGEEAIIFQCVVPDELLIPKGPIRSIKPDIPNWREVYRYPGEIPPSKEFLLEDFKRTLNQLFEKFAQQ